MISSQESEQLTWRRFPHIVMPLPSRIAPIRILDRYALFDEIAAGGMATVHLARLIGPVGFSRTVAIKRLHSHFARDPEFSAGFVDEARLAARIHHPNVVSILDVLTADGELSLVMDYVEGDSLAKLMRQTHSLGLAVPYPIASAIICGCLYGLHAAHEAKSEQGEPLGIVHRDVSPQNILVGLDGVSRIVDFGVAKAASRLQTTADGQVKGKIAYMAPEQITDSEVSRRTDIYALGVVLWELLAGRRLFKSDNQVNLMTQVLHDKVPLLSSVRPDCPPALDLLVQKATAKDPKQRYRSAREMALDLQRVLPPPPPTDVGDFLLELAPDWLTARRDLLTLVESADLEDLTGGGSGYPNLSSSRSGLRQLPAVDPSEEPTRVDLRKQDEDGAEAITDHRIIVQTKRASRPAIRRAASAVAGAFLLFGLSTAWWVSRDSQVKVVAVSDPMTAARPVESSAPPPPQVPSVTPTPSPAPSPGPVSSHRVTTQKPPCPKYFIDAHGIRRINRKCW